MQPTIRDRNTGAKKLNFFTVLTRGRTGSSALIDDLDQHPEIVCHQELFRAEPLTFPSDKVPIFEVAKRDIQFLSSRDYLQEVATHSPGKLVGFKTLMFHLELRSDASLESYIFESSMPIIFLTRDPVRAALSAAIAKERKLFYARKDEESQDHLKRRVTLDPAYVSDEARFYAYWSEQWQEKLLASKKPHIVVTYEQYLKDRLALTNSIFRFLKVRELSDLPTNNYSKVTSENVWADIVNYREVRRAIADTELSVKQTRSALRKYLDKAVAAVAPTFFG